MTEQTGEAVWEHGWDGHQQRQLRRLAELSLADKLKWLEEADRLVRHLSGAALGAFDEDRSLKRSP